MYTIGQFSKICQVTTKALRHYEKIGLLIPSKVEEENLYRYYTPEQVALVKNIAFMKELGFSLNTAKQLIDQLSESDKIIDILEEHKKALLKELDLCNGRLVKLARWKKTLEANEMKETPNYDIRIRDIQETSVRSVRKKITAVPENIGPLIRNVLEEINSAGGVPAGPPIMLYYDEEFNPEEMDMEAAWPVLDENLANKTLPPIQAATCMHVGPYDGLCDAYEAVFTWINQNGYQAIFPTREISYNDPQTTPPEKLVTEIIVPIARD